MFAGILAVRRCRTRAIINVKSLTGRKQLDQAPCVLIAEDEILIGFYLQTLLEGEGLRVAGIAATASEALRLAGEMRPAAAILDISLPDLDGIELAHRLRAEYGIAIIFVSGFGDAETRERVEAISGAGFIEKPVHPAELISMVRRLLSANSTD